MGNLDVFYPLQRLSSDTIGPIAPTPAGMKHTLVIIDHFTKFVWLFTLPDLSADATARLLFDMVLCLFGIPTEILTDGGSDLLSAAM